MLKHCVAILKIVEHTKLVLQLKFAILLQISVDYAILEMPFGSDKITNALGSS